MKFFSKLFLLFLILFAFTNVSAQKISTALKQEAISEMNAGRYGEAIDLLNKYISANPQNADGYNMRGICNENRKSYEQAVYDFRSAAKLEPKDKQIAKNLARATKSWYSLIYNEIEGYKREIAINPNKAINYLQIGKSYKNLGEWATAEEWYDQYLKEKKPLPMK